MRVHFATVILCISILLHNIRISAQPVAGFLLSRHKVCSGSAVSFINTSVNANQYSWLVDGTVVSTATDTTMVFNEPCYDLKEIRLIACDTTFTCDTTVSFIEVFDSCFFHLTGDILKCPGDTVSLVTHAEAIAVSWDIQPPHNFITGCDTCMSISFVIQSAGVLVDELRTYEGNCTEIASRHYLCMTGTGIHGISEMPDEINVYPNPFSDLIKINAGDGSFPDQALIYDSRGRLISKIENADEIHDLSFLDPGMYFLEIHFFNNGRLKTYRSRLIHI